MTVRLMPAPRERKRRTQGINRKEGEVKSVHKIQRKFIGIKTNRIKV